MKFLALRTFQRDYKKLPRHIQKETDNALRLLADNPRHPSLRIKKMQGTKGIWEGSVTMAYRFTFHLEGNTVVLRRIGTHDILKKEQ